MNIVDKVVGYFDPKSALDRMRARAMMSVVGGFVGASSESRALRGWITKATSANDSVGSGDLDKIRARSRDLVRNTPIATGAINTMVQNIIGTGLSLVPSPDAEALGITEEQAAELAKLIEREFKMWADTPECDICRTDNFYQLTELACRAWLESGDVFSVLPMVDNSPIPYSTRVQLIEADRVANPKTDKNSDTLVDGVVLEPTGAPKSYWILKQHPSGKSTSNIQADQFPAFDIETGRRSVVHVFKKMRPGQVRGWPLLAPVIEVIKQLGRYTDAEIMAAVINSFFTVFIETEGGEGIQTTVDADGNPVSASDEEIALSHGNVVDLKPGEKATFADPKRPNAAFDPFVQAVLRQIGVALGLPFEVLVKHFTASYSAARAALLEAWKEFRNRREFMATKFCQPIYEAWFAEAVALGRIDAPGFFDDPAIRQAYVQAEWIGDGPGSIDPVKEVDYAKGLLELKLSTRAEETLRLTGGVWEQKVRQLAREEKVLEQLGLNAPVPAPGQDPNNPQQPEPNPDKGDNDTEDK
jgi:lambda family phage portal protein